MEISKARRVRGPRMKPLASCLALAFAIGSAPLAAAPANFAEHPSIERMLTRFRPILDPHYVPPPRDLENALRHRPTVPLPNPHPKLPDAVIPVTNCNDSGPGSLRDAIDNIAVTGDTIDLTNTGCSTITLTTGDIFITQDDLTLQGPGSSALEIYGSFAHSMRHTGAGTLAFYDLSMYGGEKYLDATYNLNANGGCIYSSGVVTLSGAELKYCTAETANPAYVAFGGAVYAKSGVTIVNSSVILGQAGGAGTYGFGGGVFTKGSAIVAYSLIGVSSATYAAGGLLSYGLLMKYSSVSYNSAYEGAGVFNLGSATMLSSTIASNDSGSIVGGAYLAAGATDTVDIVNSTISGNTAQLVGGVAVVTYSGNISNSTIANNVEANATNTKYGAGLYGAGAIDLESTIIATNMLNHSTYGLTIDDIGGVGTLTGANNLTEFVVPPAAPPAGTLYGDPQLQALASNGGLTATQALTIGSIAIEAGNNNAGLSYDQRGVGFPRIIGAFPDIGAFEFDSDDVIFANGFD